jgi:hypothetical protein
VAGEPVNGCIDTVLRRLCDRRGGVRVCQHGAAAVVLPCAVCERFPCGVSVSVSGVTA